MQTIGRINHLGTKYKPVLDLSINVQIRELHFLEFLAIHTTQLSLEHFIHPILALQELQENLPIV